MAIFLSFKLNLAVNYALSPTLSHEDVAKKSARVAQGQFRGEIYRQLLCDQGVSGLGSNASRSDAKVIPRLNWGITLGLLDPLIILRVLEKL